MKTILVLFAAVLAVYAQTPWEPCEGTAKACEELYSKRQMQIDDFTQGIRDRIQQDLRDHDSDGDDDVEDDEDWEDDIKQQAFGVFQGLFGDYLGPLGKRQLNNVVAPGSNNDPFPITVNTDPNTDLRDGFASKRQVSNCEMGNINNCIWDPTYDSPNFGVGNDNLPPFSK